MSFYTGFVRSLLNAGFRPVQNLYDSEAVTPDSKYIGLLKRVGNVVYAVVVFNIDNEKYYKQVYEQITRFFKQHIALSQNTKIVLTGVFASENPDADLTSFCTLEVSDFDGYYTEIRWIADTGLKKRVVPGYQPDSVLDIGTLADNSFEKAGSSATIRDMASEANNNDRKRIKSGSFVITLILLALNGIVFVAMELMGGSTDTQVLTDFGAIDKSLILGGEWFRLLTYMFLHIGIMHLLANGLSLYILGSRTERHYGKIAFVVIYFVSGIVAGVASMLFGDALSAGASGAIFGLVGAMITYTFVVGKSMDGFDLQLALFYAVIGMGSGFLMENVDNFAHIGGFVTGALVSLPFALKLKKEVNNG